MSDVVKKNTGTNKIEPSSDKKVEQIVNDASSLDKAHFKALLKNAESKWKNKMDTASLDTEKSAHTIEKETQENIQAAAKRFKETVATNSNQAADKTVNSDLLRPKMDNRIMKVEEEKIKLDNKPHPKSQDDNQNKVATKKIEIPRKKIEATIQKTQPTGSTFEEKAQGSKKTTESKQTKRWKISEDSTTPVDYLLNCLVIVSKLLKHEKSPQHICHGLPLQNGFLTVALFQRAAERCTLSSRLNKIKLKSLSSLTSPAVLLLNGQRACVLVGLNHLKGTAKVIYPETGEGVAEINLSQLERDYTGFAFFLRVQYQFNDQENQSKDPSVSGHWFWGTLTHSWKIYRDVLLASLLINLFAVASPLFVMNVYDRVIPNQAMETLWVLAIGASTVFGFDMMMRLLRTYFIDLAGKKSDLLLSSSLFQHVLGINLSARPTSVGSFSRSIQDFENIRDFITSSSISALVDLPFTLFLLATIYMLGGSMVAPVMIAIGLVLTYGFILHIPLKRAVAKTVAASAEKNAILIETLSGLETIKSIQAESKLQARWENTVSHISRCLLKSKGLSSSVSVIAGTVQQLLTVVLVVMGAYAVGEGNLSMGALIAVVMLSGRCLAPMMQVTALITRYHQAKSALTTLNQVMLLPLEINSHQQFTFRDSLQGDITLQNLSFSYNLSEPGKVLPVLKNINLQIKPGEKVAIIGRIGSGKSTLLKLILGLLQPLEGHVLIDKTDIRQISPADIRRNIGSILQEGYLFSGTLKENLILGLFHASDEKIQQAAQLAGILEFSNKHPDGLEMQVGERGSFLSSGQRQAIALARVFIKEPNVLLLDEPCDVMDGFTEVMVRRNLAHYASNKTLVMITHKPTMLDIVDRIIVMDEGRIVADGPKQKIIAAMQAGKLQTGGA